TGPAQDRIEHLVGNRSTESAGSGNRREAQGHARQDHSRPRIRSAPQIHVGRASRPVAGTDIRVHPIRSRKVEACRSERASSRAMTKISLAENFRAIFYAPLYALRALDFITREGLAVEWLQARAPGAVFDEIKRGTVDLAWGGPMRVIKDRDGGPAAGNSLSCFGEIVSRDPFYLLARPGWQG